MTFETILLETDARGVATLTLNRPEAHNAMSERLMAEVPEAVRRIAADSDIRAVILTGAGDSFCAGGDLKWMKSVLSLPIEERLAGSRRIADILGALNGLPCPLIGRINGPAYGGGVGLMSVCDIVIAARGARFGLTEVKLGLIPANIGPYVVTRMGAAKARQVMLNARLFDADEAKALGLVGRVVDADALDGAVEEEIGFVLGCGPEAVAATKNLIAHIDRNGAAASIDHAMAELARIWEGAESREGITAFLERRAPSWAKRGD